MNPYLLYALIGVFAGAYEWHNASPKYLRSRI